MHPAAMILNSFIHQVNIRNSHTRSSACWKCGELGHFQKDCNATLNSQAGDKDDTTLSGPSHTIGWMSHTLTTTMLIITDLTFKAILRELVSSAIGNKRAFCLKLQTTLNTPIQVIMPVVTTVACTSSPSTTSLPTPTINSPGSVPHSVSPNRSRLCVDYWALNKLLPPSN